MAFDSDGFVKDLNLSAEEEASVRATLGKPERLDLLDKNQLRQQDYSKQSNALKKAQGDLQTQIDRLNAEQVEWASLTAAERDAAGKLRSDLEAHQAKVLTLTQRVQRIASEAGLDPQKALEGIDQVVTPPVKVEQPPPVDLSKFVPADQFASMSEYLFNLASELPMLADEHQALTGQRLDTRALRQEIAERAKQKGANLDPRAIWEEKDQIQEKRQAKEQAARSAELEAARTEGYQRARSESALPVAPSNGVNSPLLRSLDGKPRESVLSRPAPEDGIRAATAALAAGKYRQQNSATS